MSWIFASLPLLIFIVLTWWLSGYVVTRYLFALKDGLTIFALAMPCGMLTYLLFVNGLSYFISAPISTWIVNIGLWIGILFFLRTKLPPLEWEITYRTRIILGIVSLVFLVLVFLLVAREIWGDTDSHATMVNLLAHGQFPLRFQCNPQDLAAYQYGGDLLAATSTVTAGIPPWNGLHVVIACTVYSVVSLVFLLAWRRTKSITAGFLGIFLIFTISHFVWLYLPLATGGMAYVMSNMPENVKLSSAISSLLENPWKYAVTPPGFLTTNYTHSLRSISWGFGPFMTLLFLVLVDTPFSKRWIKTLALAYVLGSVSLLQPGSLVLIAFGLGIFTGLYTLFRKHIPMPDFNPWGVIVISILIAVIQGGVITDGVQSTLQGVKNDTTSFALKPFNMPGCEGSNSVQCALLSISNLGLAPLLLPLLIWNTMRSRKDIAQIILVFGALACYLLSTVIRYGYSDWNFLRIVTFASWTLAPFIAVLLYNAFKSGQIVKILVASIAIFLTSYSGVIASWVIIDGQWIGDTYTLDFSAMVPKLDQEMMLEAEKLPLDAVVFDSQVCTAVTASRPGYLFGRYAHSSLSRNQFAELPEGFESILKKPAAEILRQYGYTHLYVDSKWYNSMSDTGRETLRFGNFETLAVHGDTRDFRILLRVCGTNDTCVPDLSAIQLSLPYVPNGRVFGDEVRFVGYSAIPETGGLRLSLLTEALRPLKKNYHYSLRLISNVDANQVYPLDGGFSTITSTWKPSIRNETINIIFKNIPSGRYRLILRIYDYDSPTFMPLPTSPNGDVDAEIASNVAIP